MNAAPDLVSVSDLRPATLGDVGDMSAMINRFAAQGRMLPKSTAELARTFREYVVLTATVVGVIEHRPAFCGVFLGTLDSEDRGLVA